MIGIRQRAFVGSPEILVFSPHSLTHHDHHDNQAVEERPESVVKEPLVLPLRLDELRGNHVGESNVVDGRQHDNSNDDVAQLQEHIELGGLLLVLETVDGVQQRLQDPEVEHGVDQRGGDDAPQLQVGGCGEGRGDGIPKRKHEVDDTHENHADAGFPERCARDAKSTMKGGSKRNPMAIISVRQRAMARVTALTKSEMTVMEVT